SYCLLRQPTGRSLLRFHLFLDSSWGSKIKSLFLMIIEKQSVLCLKGFTELFAIRRLPELAMHEILARDKKHERQLQPTK
uniref:Uncharacterized protein n=1 Tax=Cucumis melo TaxID=3656 RepID=A0A9I9E8J5_CUCME